jgi:hypothetical protein
MLSPELNAMLTRKSDIQERIIDLRAERRAIISYYIFRFSLGVPGLIGTGLLTVITGNIGIMFFGVVFCTLWGTWIYFDSGDIHGELLDNIEAMNRNKGLLKKVENQIEDWVTR